MNSTPRMLKSVASIHFHRSRTDQALYYVTRKQGTAIPGFLGKLPYEPYVGAKEYILLDYDLKDDGETWEWSFYTTNKEAVATEQDENPDQEIARVRITSFTVTQNQRAYGSYNGYALLIEFSKDWEELEIQFFEEMERWASCVFTTWEHGLVDESIKSA